MKQKLLILSLFLSQTLYPVSYSFSSIPSPGFYKLAANVSNQITISSSNVTLDMNGHTVSGGTNGIVINSNLNNVTIKNGIINQVTSDGILVNSGCLDVTLKDIAVKNAVRGVAFDDVSNGFIQNCDLNINTTGLHLESCRDILVTNCTASKNVQAGFSLLDTTTCSLLDCKAISTGDGNSNSSGSESFIFGFVSSDGHSNNFERCIANSSQNLNATDQDTIVAGFGFKGNEKCSKIFGCEAGNGATSTTGFSVPYGIWLEGTFDELTTQTEVAGQGTLGNFIDWSPDGKYIVAPFDTGSENIGVYEYDRFFNRLILVATATIGNFIFHGAWSPDGKYIAIALTSAVANEFRIYKFDRITYQLSLVDVYDHTVAGIGCSWSIDGLYVAFSGVVSGGASQLVFKFDRLSEQMTLEGTANTTEAESIEWSPVERDIFAIGNDSGQVVVKSFDRATGAISTIDTLSLGTGQINKIAWSPDGKYIAVASDNTGDDIEVVLYQNETLSLVVGDNVGSGQGVSWSPGGRYLAAAFETSLRVYKFDRNGETLTALDTVNFGDTVREVEWSPDGEFIALTGDSDQANPVIIAIYSGITFPQKNVIQDNKVYCNSGNSCPGGVGIFGSSISNSIIGNAAFDNAFNYQAVTNVFNDFFGLGPSALQNCSLASTKPICTPLDVPAKTARVEVLLESLIDNLL